MDPHRPRDMVYCHQCENEWYRDEHGLVCPSCHSDFTEILESGNDPRSDTHPPLDDDRFAADEDDLYAADPDEEDIDNLQLEQTGPGTYRLRGTYRTDIPIGPNARNPQLLGQGQGGLMGMVGNVLQSMLTGQQGPSQQPQQPQNPTQHQPWAQQGQTPRADSAPNSPPPPSNGGTIVHHREGPGFSYTMTTTSNHNFGGNLYPRNANAPQPFQPQPDHIEQLLGQMFANIGAVPGGPMAYHGMQGGAMPAPGNPLRGGRDGFAGGPRIIIGGPGGMQAMPFANLFQLFTPPGGVAGDAVYSQEALDRIITQLMEQHQTGNAPGPASEAAIKALPTKTISESDLSDSGKAECSICMDEINIGGTVTVLPCQHWFHLDCIRAWLGEHDTCPHCRQGIMPKDGDASASRPRQPNQAPRHDMHSPEYTRSNIPGGYPFPQQDAGSGSDSTRGADGSQQNPFWVPDSPTMNRRNSTGGDRRRSSGGGGNASGSGGGVFSRMRDAFGDTSSGVAQALRTLLSVPNTSDSDMDRESLAPEAIDARRILLLHYMDGPTPPDVPTTRGRTSTSRINEDNLRGVSPDTSISIETFSRDMTTPQPDLRRRQTTRRPKRTRRPDIQPLSSSPSTTSLGPDFASTRTRRSTFTTATHHIRRTATFLPRWLAKTRAERAEKRRRRVALKLERIRRERAAKAADYRRRHEAKVAERRRQHEALVAASLAERTAGQRNAALFSLDDHVAALRRQHSRFNNLDEDGAESMSMLEVVSGGSRNGSPVLPPAEPVGPVRTDLAI